MPKSKHRKLPAKHKPTNKKRTVSLKLTKPRSKDIPLTLVDGMLRLTRESFEKVKTEHDFVNLVRVGRLLNCLGFSMQLIADKRGMSKILEQRFHYRTIYVMGGYLYEGYHLIDDLWSRYKDADFIAGFAALKLERTERRRKIVQKIRDGVGFHLDWKEKVTSATIAKLDLDHIELISFESNELGNMYVSAADVIDLNYLLDELKGAQTEPDTLYEIYNTLSSLVSEFSTACDLFINGLIVRLKLTTYQD